MTLTGIYLQSKIARFFYLLILGDKTHTRSKNFLRHR